MQPASLPLWLPLLLAALTLFAGLGSYGLLDNNEGLYGEIGREMSHALWTGDALVLPQVIGLPYLEKPPLLYYSVAAAMSVFGESEWAARLPSALAALACLLGSGLFARQLGRTFAGRLAMVILTSSVGFALMARVVMFDMLLTTCLNLALFGFWLSWRGGSRAWLRGGYVLLALAVLTKGLVALVLAGLVLGAYFLIWQRRHLLPALRLLADGPGLLLFLAVAVPWHVLASQANDQFAHFYFINEHVLRFLGKRIPHDYYSGSMLYYLPRLVLFLLPWPIYLLLRPSRPTGAANATAADATETQRFLWAAWLAPLIFFSLSSAKANYYLVVVMPPLALLIALRIEAILMDARQRRQLIWPSLALVVSLALGLAAYGIKTQGDFGLAAAPDPMVRLVCALLVLACALAAWLAAWRGRYLTSLVAVALLPLPLEAYALHVAADHESRFSSRPLAQAMTRLCPQCEVYLYKDFEAISSLPFYLQRAPKLLDSTSNDLYFAQHSGAYNDRFLTSRDLAAQPAPRGLQVVVLDERLADFQASPLAPRLRLMLHLGRANLFMAAPIP